MLRRRQRQYDGYRQDVCIMDTQWVQHVYGRYTKEQEFKKIADETGNEAEIVDWDQRLVFDPMTGYRNSQVLPWNCAVEILFVVNFKQMHWFTFRVDLKELTITVLDCQNDIVKNREHANNFRTMMEVSKL